MPNNNEVADNQLVLSAQKGDLEAFDVLISRYEKRVIGLCFRHLRQYEEACDLAQEVFIQVFHHLKSFKQQSSFSTWIYRVCLNACYNRQRYMRAKGRNRVDSLEGMLERREAGADTSQLMKAEGRTALDNLVRNEAAELVQEGLEALRDEFRKVIELVDLEGLHYEEVAAVLKIPVNTVRSRLSRARQALKKAVMRVQKRKGEEN
jgi:RNA polymerase sigma-70 factor (ECF subfamily)